MNTWDCKLYSDQTGRFPYVSSRGNQYIMLMNDEDSNEIMVEALKTWQRKELATTLKKLCSKLKVNINESNLFILDNDVSSSVKNTISSFNANYQVAPPH